MNDDHVQKELLSLRKQLSEAENDLKRARDKGTQRELIEEVNYLKMELGWLLFDAGEYESGIILYESLPSKTHGRVKIEGISRALVEMKRYQEARLLIENGLKRYPDSFVLWNNAGHFYLDLGDELQALNCFKAALEFSPIKDKPSILYNIAVTLGELGYSGDAEAILLELLKKYPDNQNFLVEMGHCALGRGYPTESLQWFLRAMKCGGPSPEIIDGLYLACRESGFINDALLVAMAGLKEFPSVPEIYEIAGYAFLERRWFSDAKEVAEKGLKQFPDDEGLKDLLRNITEKLEDPDDGGNGSAFLLLIVLAVLVSRKPRRN